MQVVQLVAQVVHMLFEVLRYYPEVQAQVLGVVVVLTARLLIHVRQSPVRS